MSRVLVTGAGGFIGRHALPGLVTAGHEVHAVTSRSPGDVDEELAVEVRWHSADLLAPELG